MLFLTKEKGNDTKTKRGKGSYTQQLKKKQPREYHPTEWFINYACQ